jgi:hypothetical protein
MNYHMKNHMSQRMETATATRAVTITGIGDVNETFKT